MVLGYGSGIAVDFLYHKNGCIFAIISIIIVSSLFLYAFVGPMRKVGTDCITVLKRASAFHISVITFK